MRNSTKLQLKSCKKVLAMLNCTKRKWFQV